MQSVAWSLPAAPAYFPTAHLMQFADSAASWYMPSGQGVHHCAPHLRGQCKVKFAGITQNSQVDPAVLLKIP